MARARMAFVFLLVASAMVGFDVTIVNIALPSLTAELNLLPQGGVAVASVYGATLAAFLIMAGRWGDGFGRYRVVLTGVVVFTVTSLVAGMSQSLWQLLLARGLQGVGAALIIPQVVSYARVLFPKALHPRVIGIISTVSVVSGLTGPLVGGLLLQADVFALGWRIVFLVNVPVGIIVIGGLAACLHGTQAPVHSGLARADRLSTLCFITATLCSIVCLLLLRQPSTAALALPVAAVVAVALVLVIRTERGIYRRAATGIEVQGRRNSVAPLVAPEVTGSGQFRVGLTAQLVAQVAIGGFLLTLTYFLQVGRGVGTVDSGLLVLPIGLGTLVGVALAGARGTSHHRQSLIIGGCLATGSAAALGMVQWGSSLEAQRLDAMLIATAGMGLGVGMMAVPAMALTLAEIPVGLTGTAAGVVSTAQQFGTALGAGLLGSIYTAIAVNQARSGVAFAVIAWACAGLLAVCSCMALRFRPYAAAGASGPGHQVGADRAVGAAATVARHGAHPAPLGEPTQVDNAEAIGEGWGRQPAAEAAPPPVPAPYGLAAPPGPPGPPELAAAGPAPEAAEAAEAAALVTSPRKAR